MRVGIFVRSDAGKKIGGDYHLALDYADAVRHCTSGIDIEVFPDLRTAVDSKDLSLLHLFNVERPFEAQVVRSSHSSVPYVVTPVFHTYENSRPERRVRDAAGAVYRSSSARALVEARRSVRAAAYSIVANARAVLPHTDAEAADLSRWVGLPVDHRWLTLPNCVGVPEISPVDKLDAPAYDGTRPIVIGRIEERKQQAELLEVLAISPRMLGGVTFFGAWGSSKRYSLRFAAAARRAVSEGKLNFVEVRCTGRQQLMTHVAHSGRLVLNVSSSECFSVADSEVLMLGARLLTSSRGRTHLAFGGVDHCDLRDVESFKRRLCAARDSEAAASMTVAGLEMLEPARIGPRLSAVYSSTAVS